VRQSSADYAVKKRQRITLYSYVAQGRRDLLQHAGDSRMLGFDLANQFGKAITHRRDIPGGGVLNVVVLSVVQIPYLALKIAYQTVDSLLDWTNIVFERTNLGPQPFQSIVEILFTHKGCFHIKAA
jgi:hypothetical protein